MSQNRLQMLETKWTTFVCYPWSIFILAVPLAD
jgi:hypothetical protein